jgi:hypothetical protein
VILASWVLHNKCFARNVREFTVTRNRPAEHISVGSLRRAHYTVDREQTTIVRNFLGFLDAVLDRLEGHEFAVVEFAT